MKEQYKNLPLRSGVGIVVLNQKNKIFVDISDKEIMERKEKWKQPDLKIKKGILYKYLKSVSNASNGCVTDE